MSNCKIPESEPQTLEELAAIAYGMELSARERVIASTVSVDEYFDELIEQVQQAPSRSHSVPYKSSRT